MSADCRDCRQTARKRQRQSLAFSVFALVMIFGDAIVPWPWPMALGPIAGLLAWLLDARQERREVASP